MPHPNGIMMAGRVREFSKFIEPNRCVLGGKPAVVVWCDGDHGCMLPKSNFAH